MCENTLHTLQQKGTWRCCNKKLTVPWDQMSTCYKILKYPLRPRRHSELYCTHCACWHGYLQHRQLFQHINAISALSNLSCKPELNSRFPPEQQKKKNFARKPIVMEPSLTPLLCKASTPGTWPQHSHPRITSSCFERKWQDAQWATVGAGRKARLAGWLRQVVLQVKG